MVTESVQDAPGVDVEADRRRMWEVSLHEAGHLVAARVLLKMNGTKGMVFGDGSGLAFVGSEVPTFKHALVRGAGLAAERLAHLYDPPEDAMPKPAENIDPQGSARWREAMKTIMCDARALFEWALKDHENTWTARYDWVESSSLEFAIEHRHEIFETATALFSCGIITLPAKPEEGSLHVDRVENAGS